MPAKAPPRGSGARLGQGLQGIGVGKALHSPAKIGIDPVGKARSVKPGDYPACVGLFAFFIKTTKKAKSACRLVRAHTGQQYTAFIKRAEAVMKARQLKVNGWKIRSTKPRAR